MKKKYHQMNLRGAFLLEALLAVFILSFALAGLIRGLLMSLNAAVESEKYSRAILAAENSMLEVFRLNGQKADLSEDPETPAMAFSPRITLKRLDEPDPMKGLTQVHVSVTWPGVLNDKEISASTLIFGPSDEKP